MGERRVCVTGDSEVNQAAVNENQECWAVCGARPQKRVDGTAQDLEGPVDRKEELLRAAKMKVDLHIHSVASDGTKTIREIFSQAVEKNISIIAITDHNTMDNVSTAMKLSRQYGLTCIPAMEVSAVLNRQEVHILAYGICIQDKRVYQYELCCIERIRNRDLLAVSRIFGTNSYEYITDYEKYTYSRQRGGWKLLNFLLDRKAIISIEDYLNYEKQGIITDVEYPDVEEAIHWIHSCNGYAIAAHPGSYDTISYTDLIEDMGRLGIDGIEVFHPHNNKEVQEYCLNWAEKNHKLITGGSDYHGNLPDRILGYPQILLKDLKLGNLKEYI